MTQQEHDEFIMRDRQNFAIARSVAITLTALNLIEKPNKLGAFHSYWMYKMEPNRDAIIEYIQEKSQ